MDKMQRLEELTRQLALARTKDSLTGILNQEGFVQHAAALMEQYQDTRYAVIKLKIDHIGYINQIYGYETGDTVLRDTAQNLERSCGEGEICARVEKCGFALLLRFQTEEKLSKRLERLDRALLSKRLRNQIQIPVLFLGGVYLPAPDERTIKDMLDKALSARKSAVRGKNKSSYAYFNRQEYEAQRYSAQLFEQAPGAMRRGEFKLYLQPQVDLRTMEVTAAEALTRWICPDGKCIMPDDFISLFEREGQIIEFDFYMLELLCQHMRGWLDAGIMLKPISINQSRLHIKTLGYLQRFCEVVDRYGIPHDYVAFELTESAFTGERKAMFHLAQELHKKNFKLELDDFGSGYASLDLISTLYADVLKLDRSLIAGLNCRQNERSLKVVQKVIELAHDTGMTVICEGVETQRQLDYLKELNCDVVQGFYFYRPMPSGKFEHLVLRGERQSRVIPE